MKPFHILLVEDNEADILLTKEALDDLHITVKLSIANDGEEAINFIEQKEIYAEVEGPDIILLDVNLPKKNGYEVLKFVKEHNNYKHIPVIMLTTSSTPMDINLSYRHHANCFITKPVEVKDFINVISTIKNFWTSIVKLPKNK